MNEYILNIGFAMIFIYFYIMNKESIIQKIRETIAREVVGAKIILFGSRARGTENNESDWDILVLLDKPFVTFKEEQNIRHKLYEVELEVEEPISTFVYSLADWNSKMSVTPLFKNVSREGVYL
jgi:predicted nucleotidyltransferase